MSKVGASLTNALQRMQTLGGHITRKTGTALSSLKDMHIFTPKMPKAKLVRNLTTPIKKAEQKTENNKGPLKLAVRKQSVEIQSSGKQSTKHVRFQDQTENTSLSEKTDAELETLHNINNEKGSFEKNLVNNFANSFLKQYEEFSGNENDDVKNLFKNTSSIADMCHAIDIVIRNEQLEHKDFSVSGKNPFKKNDLKSNLLMIYILSDSLSGHTTPTWNKKELMFQHDPRLDDTSQSLRMALKYSLEDFTDMLER